MTNRVIVGAGLVAAVLAGLLVPGGPAVAQESDAGWLALGDSYSSGEGIPGTPAAHTEEAGNSTQGRDCKRATGNDTEATAWSVSAFDSVASDLGLEEMALVACTGAVSDEADDQIGEARARFGRSAWEVVSFSFGGNDIGFADVLKGCLDANNAPWGAFDLTPGCDVDENELRRRVDMLVGNAPADATIASDIALSALYDEVVEIVVPGGDVIVVGYPQLVEETGRWDFWRRNGLDGCEGIRDYDVGMLRGVTGYLNQQIALAVAAADERHRAAGVRFHFVDISADPYEFSGAATDRHALCSTDPWLNGRTLGIRSGDVWELERSFHPTQVGHDNTGRVLATFINTNITLDDAPAPPPEAAIASDVAVAFVRTAIEGGNLSNLIAPDEEGVDALLTLAGELRSIGNPSFELYAQDGEIISNDASLGPGCADIGDSSVECEVYYDNPTSNERGYVFFLLLRQVTDDPTRNYGVFSFVYEAR